MEEKEFSKKAKTKFVSIEIGMWLIMLLSLTTLSYGIGSGIIKDVGHYGALSVILGFVVGIPMLVIAIWLMKRFIAPMLFSDKDKIIYELWVLLDDIDSAGDLTQSPQVYRSMIEKIHKKRFEYLSEHQVDALYKHFYARKGESKNEEDSEKQ
jgi:hypothetical protein